MSQGVSRLRELLFDEETARINNVDDRVDAIVRRLESVEELTQSEQRERAATLRQIEQIFERAGTEERFTTSVAGVIDRALEEAEVARHAQVSRAMAPLVVSTIKTELKNSQDEMVQVLYPITGRLVQAYVASAMKDLADQINRRLTQNPVSLKWRSFRTGVPVSDLVLADTERLVVDEIYMIRRGSGELLARWPGGAQLSNQDIHMSGVLTAINEFAENAFEIDGGNLRSFRADDFQFFLRASPMYLLAARCRGSAPAAVEQVFDEEFLSFLAEPAVRGDGVADVDSTDLGVFAEGLNEEVDQRYAKLTPSGSSMGLLKGIAVIFLLPLLAWFGWMAFTSWEEYRVREIASGVIRSTDGMEGYPTTLDVGYRGKTLALSGLTPTDTVRTTLLSDMKNALPETTELASTLNVLPTVRAPVPPPPVDLTPLERQVRSVETRLVREGLSRVLRRTEVRLAQARAEVAAFVAADGPAARKEQAARALSEITAVQDRVAQLSKTSADPDTDLAALQGATNAIRSAQRDVDRAFATVAQVLGAPIPDAANAAPRTTDGALDAASDISASAERLASTISAVRQAGSLKLPQPQPPQIVRETVAPTITPEDRLETFARRNAVFFSSGTNFRTPDAALKTLEELAGLIKAANLPVRVVGYTDERGGLNRNNTLALERANVIRLELVDRGVPANRVVAVGRAAIRDLSPRVGDRSPNRRVEFEIGFTGEFEPAAQ
ncbi:MAG: OmpA family protein [Pseudomonadota bacterium]